jgi:hypothetical protein
MGKRNKHSEKMTASPAAAGDAAVIPRQGHAPAKQPTLLAVSIILFALWFIFLLITALTG